ncbi:MAG: hypothetical protein KBA66_04790 [Leptospiraceae bacterium]|nr:hypothetical protein [Leptospiraceae bacterium]
MKIKLFLLFLFMTTIIFPSKGHMGKWSAYQGWMNWNDARAKCKSINMRLPTRKEFQMARKAGITESWKKDGAYYWTKEELPNSNIYVFGIFTDRSITGRADKGKHTRCIR